jgi:hypothetical protein
VALQGAIPVQFGHVFPHGAYVLSVQPVRDFDKSTREHTVQEREKDTGELVWSVEVIDADPDARESTVRVKIAAPVQPVPPDPAPGVPFRPVEFDGLTLVPWVDGKRCVMRHEKDRQCKGRVAFSYRAKVMRAPSRSAAKASVG